MTTGDIIYTVLFSLLGLGMIFCILMLRRNEKVHAIRGKLLEQISVAAKADISRFYAHAKREIERGGKPDLTQADTWQWRYDAYDSVGYNQMVLTFWRKPLSLYDNLDFIDPEVHEPRIAYGRS